MSKPSLVDSGELIQRQFRDETKASKHLFRPSEQIRHTFLPSDTSKVGKSSVSLPCKRMVRRGQISLSSSKRKTVTVISILFLLSAIKDEAASVCMLGDELDVFS